MHELTVRTRQEWRDWLADNGQSRTEVWLVVRRPTRRIPGVTHDEAVEEALCYGWVDSKAIRRDADTGWQRFTPRSPKGTWSKVNRELAERLIRSGRMAQSGLDVIAAARRSGAWDVLADAQNLVVPRDLATALAAETTAAANFTGFPPSARRSILEWIAKAKRPETRQRRIAETVAFAARGLRAIGR